MEKIIRLKNNIFLLFIYFFMSQRFILTTLHLDSLYTTLGRKSQIQTSIIHMGGGKNDEEIWGVCLPPTIAGVLHDHHRSPA